MSEDRLLQHESRTSSLKQKSMLAFATYREALLIDATSIHASDEAVVLSQSLAGRL